MEFKSKNLEIYFESPNDSASFDRWFESNDWSDCDSDELIEKVDNFFELDQYCEDFGLEDENGYEIYPIEDYTFGKDGDEKSYIQSVNQFVKNLKKPIFEIVRN